MKTQLALLALSGSLVSCSQITNDSSLFGNMSSAGRVPPNQILIKVGANSGGVDAAALEAVRLHIVQSKRQGNIVASFEQISSDGSTSFCVNTQAVGKLSQTTSRLVWVSASNGFDSRFKAGNGACADLNGDYSFDNSSLGAFVQFNDAVTLECSAFDAATQTSTRVELVEKVVDAANHRISTKLALKRSSPTARFALVEDEVAKWEVEVVAGRSFAIVYKGAKTEFRIWPENVDRSIVYHARLKSDGVTTELACP